VRRLLENTFPLLVVLGAVFLLGYPFSYLMGYPLAQNNLEDRNRWSQQIVEALPPLDIGAPAALRFGTPLEPDGGLLVLGNAPYAAEYAVQADAITLAGAYPLVLDPFTALDEGQTFRTDQVASESPVYLDKRLLKPGYEKPLEKPDGQRVGFSFSATDGVFVLRGRLLVQGVDYEVQEGVLTLKEPAPLWLALRPEADWARPLRITGDYAWADDHTVILQQPKPGARLELAETVVRWAERLAGGVDGINRTFTLVHGKLVPSDAQRQILVNDQLLRADGRRALERADGVRRQFTFPEPGGVLLLDGKALELGRDYEQAGATVTLNEPLSRRSQLLQQDYAILDADAGQLLLAQAPAPGSAVWARRYAVYDKPKCGATVFECFLSLPQHPVPLPHWIFTKAPSFVTRFEWASDRNVLREVWYTARGTLVALLSGGAVGLFLAGLFVLIRPLERAMLPWVIASQTVPIIALVPMLVLILANFGIRIQTSILPTAIIGGYLSFFPITIGAAKGLRSVEPLALDLMHSYAASPWQVFFKVRVYSALPFIFASFKVGAAASLVGALISETETSNAKGLGFAILGQVQAGNVADLWILFFISSLLGILFVSAVGWAERLLAPWVRKI